MTIDLTELIPRCHEAAKANGWWDTPRNAGEALMLCISELSEALEADRNGRHANLAKYVADTAELAANPQYSSFQPATFQELIKDTVADELADAYIRLCDFAGGFELDLSQINTMKCNPSHWVIGNDNFGDALLTCVDAVMDMHHVRLRTGFAPGHMEGPLSDALTCIEVLAEKQGIDLATHIDLKLAYNATRGTRHGGKAY